MLSLSTYYIDTFDTYQPEEIDYPISFQMTTSYKETSFEISACSIKVIQNQPYTYDKLVFRNLELSKYSLTVYFKDDGNMYIASNPERPAKYMDMEIVIPITCDWRAFLEQCKRVEEKASKYTLSTFTLKIKTS